jgi:AcrR family transcriptional regulator
MNKKDRILQEAMILFAAQGYYAISTKQIAVQAEVSEGLIFKHY